MTTFERKLWWHLRSYHEQGINFRRQVPFRSYILDFAEHSRRLVIELDGVQHGDDKAQQRDATRDALLSREGYLVLRFWNQDLIENFEAVLETIDRELAAREPPLTRRASASLPRVDLSTRKR